MPSITYDRFEVGLDLRKSASVADANRLRQLKNAYVTTGRVIRKRPGLTKVATLEAGTKGLFAGKGVLNTFYESGTITHANSLFTSNKVVHPTTTQLVERVHHADVFNGFVYASIEYADGSIKHHYLDGASPTYIADANCPNSAAWVKASSKIWSVDGEVVRFSATSLPRDWTSANDAGFLPTGLQQTGSLDALALGTRGRDLVVFFDDSAQIWIPDPDPELHVYKKPIQGVGTRFAQSIGKLSDDILFLSDSGYRSISVVSNTDSLSDADVGSPIDDIVAPLVNNTINPISIYYSGGGQYWCAIGTTVHVYTFSRTSKISAWSVYEFSIASIDAMAELNGTLYIRSADDVYRVDKSVFTDDGALYTMEMEMPFLDFKKTGVTKQIHGMDLVVQGSVDVSFKYDVNNPGYITNALTLSGDTRPGDVIPIGLISPMIAPVFSSETNEDCQIDAVTFYYENLGML